MQLSDEKIKEIEDVFKELTPKQIKDITTFFFKRQLREEMRKKDTKNIKNIVSDVLEKCRKIKQ